jgi:hypothetical protein
MRCEAKRSDEDDTDCLRQDKEKPKTQSVRLRGWRFDGRCGEGAVDAGAFLMPSRKKIKENGHEFVKRQIS